MGRRPGGTPGVAPQGHEKQCIAIRKRDGKPCRKWALRGSTTCAAHNTNRQQRTNPEALRLSHVRYGRYLGTTLAEKVAELSNPDHPVASLRDELVLMRTFVGDTLQLYSACDEIQDAEKRDAAKERATLLVVEALNRVRDMCLAMARVEKETGAVLDTATVNNIVHRIMRIIDDVLKGEEEALGFDICMRITAKMQREIEAVELATDGTRGALITPDQDILDMCATVPGPPLLTNGQAH